MHLSTFRCILPLSLMFNTFYRVSLMSMLKRLLTTHCVYVIDFTSFLCMTFAAFYRIFHCNSMLSNFWNKYTVTPLLRTTHYKVESLFHGRISNEMELFLASTFTISRKLAHQDSLKRGYCVSTIFFAMKVGEKISQISLILLLFMNRNSFISARVGIFRSIWTRIR